MKEDDKMLSYYQLVAFRHDLLIESYQKLDMELPNYHQIESSTDDYLHFMYYFVSGQVEFIKGRYKSAIRSYKIAERLIENVNDSIEKAEFYQRLGFSYYRIDQYTFAASYMEQALEIFEKNANLKEREINSKIVLAAINTELTRYDDAEIIYNEILESSRPYPFTHGLILRNIGLNRVTQRKLEEAVSFFEKALKVKEHLNSTFGTKTLFG